MSIDRRIEIIRNTLISNQQIIASQVMYGNQVKDAWLNAGDELLKSKTGRDGTPTTGEASSIEEAFSDLRGQQVADAMAPLLDPLWDNVNENLRNEGYDPLSEAEQEAWRNDLPEFVDHTQLEDVPGYLRDEAFDKAIEGVKKLAELTGDAAEYYKDNEPALQKFLDDLIQGVSDGVQSAKDSAQEAGSDISDSLSDAWDEVGEKLSDAGGALKDFLDDNLDDLMDGLKDLYDRAKNTVSPLVLDLDGDGVETISISAGIHFDHDGNGFIESTGWVSKDDGLLVWDRNGNGQIDDGSELFGNYSVLVDGSRASNGFVALADLDSNQDGTVNSSDAAFSQLRVWQDINSDAKLDAGELLSLSEVNVGGLNTAFASQNQVDAQGNEVKQTGTYTDVSGINHSMDDIWFSVDTVRTIDANQVVVSDEISMLPEVEGFGSVSDLHQAMARDVSGELKELVNQFARETDAVTRKTLLNQIIFVWSGADQYTATSRGQYIDDGRKLYALEAFMGETFFQPNSTDLWDSADGLRANPWPGATDSLTQAYDQLESYVFSQLMAQTHLKNLYDGLQLTLDSETLSFVVDVSTLVNEFHSAYEENAAGATLFLNDFYDNLKTRGSLGEEIRAALVSHGDILAQGFLLMLGRSGDDILVGGNDGDTLHGGVGSDYLDGRHGDDVLDGGIGNDELSGADGDDTLSGGAGLDYLSGGSGNDLLDGGADDDSLIGGESSDTLLGGAGNDYLDGGDGDDVLDGGVGNDTLYGNSGSDTYRFSRGWGQDSISNNDSGTEKVDAIEFATDIAPDDITLARLRSDLILSLNNSADQIIIVDYFVEVSGANPHTVEEIRFANGTILSVEQVKALILQGTSGNDELIGSAGNNTISGLQGNDLVYGLAGDDLLDGGEGNDELSGADGDDTLSGGAGLDYLSGGSGNDLLDGGADDDSLIGDENSDTLLGGAGNDYLDGGDGDDVLDGGIGNDTLYGNSGSDTYRFSRGWGQDSISNNDSGTEKVDAIEFATDIAPDDITLARLRSDLILSLNNSADQIIIVDYFVEVSGANPHTVEEIRFANGTIMNVEQVKALILQGTSGNDELIGYASNDIISGQLGNDLVYGLAGDDLLDGGEGNDELSGADGDDTLSGGAGLDYLSGGSGIDVLDGGADDDTLIGDESSDTLLGGAGNDYLDGGYDADVLDGGTGSDSMYGGDGNDTYVIDNTGDVITENSGAGTDTVNSYISYTLNANVENLSLQGASAINGTGNTGKNILNGNIADNILNGGGGNDTLNGYAGNDRLDGGSGNDTMHGGIGDDTYVVNTISDIVIENTNEGIDTVESSVTLTLGNNVENLTLTGTGALSGTGNTLNNILKGNVGANSLTGAAGNDRLDGKGGSDTLTGGTDSDTYVIGRGYGADTAVENDATVGNSDIAQFLDGIATDQLWFRKLSNNLEVSIIGTSDKLTVKDWYLGNAYHVEQFKTAEGMTLLDSQVQNLVDAMATFAPPATGQTSLPENYQAALASVIAANWQ